MIATQASNDWTEADTMAAKAASLHIFTGNTLAARECLLPIYNRHMRQSVTRQMRERPHDPRDLYLAELEPHGLSQRTINLLETPCETKGGWRWRGSEREILTAGSLCKWSADDLMEIAMIGADVIREIRAALKAVNLRLRGD